MNHSQRNIYYQILSNKIDYYLVHDDERNQIAENGYKKVCENFTYDKMLSIILEYI